jgi:hypothetical protein
MMPGYCPDNAPPGEKALYAALSSSRESDGWIVLHSLGIAEHVRLVEGEADFVVIVPDTGILVIEVKSHHTIGRRPDGMWKLGNDAPTQKGPFQQAREAMYSLRSYLEKKHVDLRLVPMIYAVWFTSVRARTMLPTSPEWHTWQVLDSEDLKAAPFAVRRTLEAGTRHLEDKLKRFSYGGVGPTAEAAEHIAFRLRPRFELAVVPGDRRRARESQLVAFVEEQFRALDAVADNRAVLFSGPAGSGKTFLAMEAARREVATGHRGRLLCFNRFLSSRLAADMGSIGGLIVGTFHQELLHITGLETVPPNAGAAFWESELPEQAMEALINGGDTLVSDFLIIDEIQDIARQSYLNVLDLMVVGGLKEGRLLFFGDFERQAVFENDEGRDLLRSRCPYLMSHKLVKNCRNLPRIGYQVNLLSHLQPGYQEFRRLDDGVDPTFLYFEAGQDQSPQLLTAIHALRDEGFSLNEIVVLSPLRAGSTAEATTDRWLRQILRPADGLPARPGIVQYATIQSFKGLDAPAVVVTDLDRRSLPNFESLLYVGLTRATDRLFAVIEPGTLRHALGVSA